MCPCRLPAPAKASVVNAMERLFGELENLIERPEL